MGMKLSDRQVRLLFVLALTALTFFVYRQTGTFEFVNLDDNDYVTDNMMVSQGLTWSGVRWAFSTFTLSNWHPLTWLSFMLDRELFGDGAGGPHLVNVFLHAINAILLFYALGGMTGCWVRSAGVAALFAVHPLHVESVAWVSERKDVLSTFFWMLTMCAYGWYARLPTPRRYLAVFAALLAGLMAKQMLVTLPFVLLLLDYWPLRRLGGGGVFDSRSLRPRPAPGLVLLEKVPLITLSAVFSAVIYYVQFTAGSMRTGAVFPMSLRIGNALVSYVHYLGKALWPVNLSVFYPHPAGGLEVWKVSAASALLLLLTWATLRFARRHPFLAVGWFWYLGTLVPVIGVVHVGWQAMADRYTYVPLIGIFIIMSWVFPDLPRGGRAGRLLQAAAASVVVILALTARWQVGHWRNSITLFSRSLEVTSDNFVAHFMLGRALVARGDYAAGIGHLKAFVRLRPDLEYGHLSLGDALSKAGRGGEAVAAYEKALELVQDYAEAHNNLGVVLLKSGRLERARHHFTSTLEINPNNAGAHVNLGALLLLDGQKEEAVEHFLAALKIEPNTVTAHRNLAALYLREGQTAEAERHQRELLRLDPDSEPTSESLEGARRGTSGSTP
jgi:Flp pilus assembly protein TadD